MFEIKVPAFGESIQEVQVATWLRKIGDWVDRDEDLVELESEKASHALPSPEAGILKEIKVADNSVFTATAENSADIGNYSIEVAALAKTHLTAKPNLPTEWFDSDVLVDTDQDFIAFHPEIVRTMTHRRTWLEMKIFRQYQAVFIESLNKTIDVNHLIAIQTRRIALVALGNADRFSMDLCTRFLNTFMRDTATHARESVVLEHQNGKHSRLLRLPALLRLFRVPLLNCSAFCLVLLSC